MRAIVIVLAAALVAVTAPATLGVTVVPGQGVEFAQVDFTWPGATILDSQTGKMRVDKSLLESETGISEGFVNVRTSTGWVVQNVMILSGTSYQFIATEFDLGTSGDVTSLIALVDYSAAPVTSFGGSPTDTFPVGTVEFNGQGFGNPPNGAEPAPPPAGIISFEIGGVFEICCQYGHSNVEAEENQCAPAAVANSFDWLERTYPEIDFPHDHNPGEQGSNTLVGQIDEDMGRTPGEPASLDQMMEGKLEYLADPAVGLADMCVKHQVEDLNDYTRHGITSKSHGVPTAQWIYEQICAGEDVELGYDGDPGHAVTVVCAGKILGRPFIGHISDHEQGTDGGTDEVDWGWVEDTDDADDDINLVSKAGSPNIICVLVESPPGHASTTKTKSWGSIKALYR
jgi:hypothetical protein